MSVDQALWPRLPSTATAIADECFGLMADHHEKHGSVCVSQAHPDCAPKWTFIEYVRASFQLAQSAPPQSSWGQPLWTLVRHTMELGLKIAGGGQWPPHHKLDDLLHRLPDDHQIRLELGAGIVYSANARSGSPRR